MDPSLIQGKGLARSFFFSWMHAYLVVCGGTCHHMSLLTVVARRQTMGQLELINCLPRWFLFFVEWIDLIAGKMLALGA